MASERASLLTIPCELRNAIYTHIFQPSPEDYKPILLPRPDVPAHEIVDDGSDQYYKNCYLVNGTSKNLDALRTCTQLRSEAQLLALSMTPFLVNGECAYPDIFDLRSRPLSATKLNAIRHITLTARISHLRALNETWDSRPFGHPSLNLDTLLIIPKRPQCNLTAYAEIADLSQSHTLAYVFSETLKGLRNVRCVEVRNERCFNEVVWRLFYRSLVYRLWRWGGGKCGIRFESGECMPGGSELDENRWFKAYLHGIDGVECGEEVVRLVGITGELPDPNLAGVGP